MFCSDEWRHATKVIIVTGYEYAHKRESIPPIKVADVIAYDALVGSAVGRNTVMNSYGKQ